MIEKIILDFFAEKLPSVPCYMELPEDKPAKMLIVEKTGGTEVNHIDSATIVVQSYAASLYEAASLNETVKELMLGTDSDAGLLGLDSIVSCRLNSDYNYTDSTTKHYRYQAVFDVIYY